MNSFDYVQVGTEADALGQLTKMPGGKILAGGTNLIDLMREGIETPPALIDATRLPLGAVIELPDGGLQIGAMVRNSHLAGNLLVRERYPMLSQAILRGPPHSSGMRPPRVGTCCSVHVVCTSTKTRLAVTNASQALDVTHWRG